MRSGGVQGGAATAPGQAPRRALRPWLVLAAALAAASSPGCRRGCLAGAEVVARVVSLVPTTELATEGSAWSPAEVGDDLRVGDALRTGKQGSATIRLAGRGEVRVAPGSLVRFAELGDQGARELRLVIEAGAMDVVAEADAPALVIDGPGGRVRLQAGSRARLVLDEAERVRLEVEAGSAELQRQDGTTVVEAGGTALLGGHDAPDAPDAGPPDGGGRPEAEVEAPELVQPEGAAAAGVVLLVGRRTTVEYRAPDSEELVRARGRRVSLEPGTFVRVSGGDGAEVQGPGGAEVALRPGSEAVVSGSRGERLDLELRRGAAEANAGGSGVVALALPGGQAATARLGGAGARLSASVLEGGRSRVAVRAGGAFARSGERVERLVTGDEAVLGPEGRISLSSQGEVPPLLQGGSAVLHDPQRRGGFTVRWTPIAGCSLYAVQVDARARRVLDAITARPVAALHDLDYGDYRWRAACIRDGTPDWSESRDGRVLRQADRSGNVLLPTSAPSNALDSDGRQYTVTYQNRLPAITLRWSDAPEAPRYALEVVDDASGRPLHRSTVSRPSSAFRSGFFQEGSYYWFFRAEGGPGRAVSPVTRMLLTFDNQAPAIQILEPRDGAPGSGSVRVRGVASVGSSVAVNGVELQLGPDYRFDQVVPAGPGNLLVFRVSTPRRGVGYYLRHLSH